MHLRVCGLSPVPSAAALLAAAGMFVWLVSISDFTGLAVLVGAIAICVLSHRQYERLSSDVRKQIDIVERQRDEREVVLASMREGVIALDRDHKIIRMNAAAFALLGQDFHEVKGCHIEQVLPDGAMLRFLKRMLATRQEDEEELVAQEAREERYIQAYGHALKDEAGHHMGVLIVLNDVTRLHRLENMRREFVANVSHELKTPVTSIKGFIETLVDGAIENPDDTRKFLNIIARQADRLNAIIEDLLSLSRVERDKEKGEVKLEKGALKEVLASAIQVCEFKARERAINVSLECAEDLTAMINPALLEQAVVNLVDNAIKCSEKQTLVKVEGKKDGDGVIIRVIDQGRGIEKVHLSRVFERFYRVDKARSRKEGGTGLGLAIVKHIAQAHGGFPSVESTPGAGSTFTIHLPG